MTQGAETNQVLMQHSWTYRWASNGTRPLPISEGASRFGRIAAIAKFESRAYRKKLRARFRIWFGLFGSKVVEFEFALHIRFKAWLSPTLKVALRLVNTRPWYSDVFAACETSDLTRIKSLFEGGAASINDVPDPDQISILDVSWDSPLTTS